MLTLLAILTLFLTLTLLYFCWLKPVRLMRAYRREITALGYRVEYHPFQFPIGGHISRFDRNFLADPRNTDPYLPLKTTPYDVIIANALNTVMIDVCNPELIKKFMVPELPDTYIKSETGIANLKRCLGGGIVFSEGLAWKNKRKVMNTVFNY